MSKYLMLFSPSELGTHTYKIDADSDEEAAKKAVKRLESSPCSKMQFQLLKIEAVIDWKVWTREN